MRLFKFLSIAVCSSFLYIGRNASCYSFHPITHANQQLFSLERVPAHKVRSDVEAVLKNFLTVKVKNLLKRLPELKNHSHAEGLDTSDYAETVLEQAKNLLQQAENKRKMSQRIKESYERAINEANKNNGEYSEKNSRILQQNLEQIEYLQKQAERLEKKAEYLKEHVKELHMHKREKKNICAIKKIGILKYVSSGNGLKHAIENVQARVEEDGFSLYHNNEKKKSYTWNLIEMPIKVIGNVKQCFFFSYKNHNEIFCGKDKLDAFSWINALSEGFFCHNFGLKGTVLNQNMDIKKIKETIANNNNEILTVEIKPDEDSTRVFINNVEQEIENSKEIDINKLKNTFEEGRKNKNDEIVEESTNHSIQN